MKSLDKIDKGARRWVPFIQVVSGFLVLFSVLYSSILKESLIKDELEHISSSAEVVNFGSTPFNPFHPPGLKLIVGAALTLAGFDLPPPREILPAGAGISSRTYARQILFSALNDPSKLILTARTAVILFNLLLLGVLLFLTYKILGKQQAILLFLFVVTSPTFLAHSRYVTFDVSVALGIAITMLGACAIIRMPTPKGVLLLGGLCFGVTLLKFSGLITVPCIVLSLFLLHRHQIKFNSKTSLKVVTSLLAVFLIGISVFYAIAIRAVPDSYLMGYSHRLYTEGMPESWKIAQFLFSYELLKPIGWMFIGIRLLLNHVISGEYNVTYFLGEVYEGGKLFFYPIIWFCKQTPALIAVVIAGTTSLFYVPAERLKIVAPLLIFLLIYGIATFFSNVDQGVRYLLPFEIAMFIVFSHSLVVYFEKYSLRYFYKATQLFCLLQLVSLSLTYPYFTSYYNSSVGGFDGGSHMTLDSNFDWGQDLKRLPETMKKYSINHIYLDYEGYADPKFDLKGYNFTPWSAAKKLPPKGSVVAISISRIRYLTAVKSSPRFNRTGYQWTLQTKPIAIAGTSIYLYKL